jgi:putative transposase
MEIRIKYIQPGDPKQNAYVERVNRTVRYEWMSNYYCSDLAEVQDFGTKWMWSYNHGLGGLTPKKPLAWLRNVSTFAALAKGDD